MTRTRSETELSKAIQNVLMRAGIPVERVQSGRVRVKGGWMYLASKGTPDLWTPLGWIECKTDSGELSPEQRLWHARAAAHGVRVAVCRSAEEALRQVAVWRKERAA